MSEHGVAAVSFLPPRYAQIHSENASKYVQIHSEKLKLHIQVHNCQIFTHDGAPCYRFKVAKNFLNNNNIELLGWPKSGPDFNPIENLWTNRKNKMSEKQPSSSAELVKVAKEIWVKEMSKEYCQSLIESMPRMEAVIKNRGGHILSIENRNIFFVSNCLE